jgi:hypothetical protein
MNPLLLKQLTPQEIALFNQGDLKHLNDLLKNRIAREIAEKERKEARQQELDAPSNLPYSFGEFLAALLSVCGLVVLLFG